MSRVSAFVSVVPGRIRLRHPRLRSPERHTALCERLRTFVDVESNPAIGSLLLRFDPVDTAMEARIRAEVDAVLFAETPDALTDPPQGAEAEPLSPEDDVIAQVRHRRQTRLVVNRIAKIGGLAGMAASLAALGTSRKLHAQFGMFAGAMILTHVATHWRRVLR